MRQPSSTDFLVSVENIGDFVFAHRVMRDELKITAEVRRMTDGLDDPGSELRLVATWLAALKVLMVRGPSKKWDDVEALDPLDPDTYAELMRVYDALRDKESSFRPRKSQEGASGRQADGGVGGVLVPEEVRAPAN